MSVLSDKDIKKLVASGEIEINPFEEANVQPASYDLSLGSVIKAGGEGKLDIGIIAIEPNNWALVSSSEIISLPNNICATYGIMSSIARKGLLHFGGPQIDPGYSGGKIFAAIYNPTLESIDLDIGKDFFTIIFFQTSSATSGYGGQYQGQHDFPSDDVSRMASMKSKDFLHVIKSVEDLHEGFKLLTTDVNDIKVQLSSFFKFLKWSGGIFLAIVAPVLAALLYDIVQGWF